MKYERFPIKLTDGKKAYFILPDVLTKRDEEALLEQIKFIFESTSDYNKIIQEQAK